MPIRTCSVILHICTFIRWHTEYSILDGAIRCKDLAQHVHDIGQTAVAITDHGNMHGVIEFYKACKNMGVKPILGIEAYCTDDPDGAIEKTRDNYHMVFLAKNFQGYQDLLWLISNANEHNFYYKPRISFKNLENRGRHLIASTACLGGPIAKALTGTEENGSQGTYNTRSGQKRLSYLREIFGTNLYLEIQDNGLPQQDPYNKWLVTEAHKQKIPLIITTDAHFLTKEDFILHQLMMAMQYRKTLQDYLNESDHAYTQANHIADTNTMILSARKYRAEDAIENTMYIAEQCNVDIELGILHPPVFDITNTSDYSQFLTWKGRHYG